MFKRKTIIKFCLTKIKVASQIDLKIRKDNLWKIKFN